MKKKRKILSIWIVAMVLMTAFLTVSGSVIGPKPPKPDQTVEIINTDSDPSIACRLKIDDTVIITWRTNIDSDSRVNYGTTTSLGSTEYDSTYTTEHSITITGLASSTLYYYEVVSETSKSSDTDDNLGAYFYFTTGLTQEDVRDAAAFRAAYWAYQKAHYVWDGSGQIADESAGKALLRATDIWGSTGTPEREGSYAYNEYGWYQYYTDDSCRAFYDDGYYDACDGKVHFDCSGLTRWVYTFNDNFSFLMPHFSSMQPDFTAPVPLDTQYLKPGDLLFKEGHDGIYVGEYGGVNGDSVEAQGSRVGVVFSNVSERPWTSAGRVRVKAPSESGDEVHVEDIVMSKGKQGPREWAIATITIEDALSAPVEGVTVDIEWSGLVEGTDSGETASDGTITFESARTRSSGTITITVTDAWKSEYSYNFNDNMETSDSIEI